MRAGCGRPSATGDDSASPSAQTVESGSSVVVSDPGAIVLVSPGRAPRSPLRLHPEVGLVSRWSATSGVDTLVAIDGARPVSRPVASRLDFEAEVTAAGADGIAYRSRVIRATYLDPPPDPGAEATLRRTFDGLECVVRSDRRGIPTSIDCVRDGAPVDVPSLPELHHALSPSLSFPAEPVGLGARWEARDELDRNGFHVLQTTEHELVARDGDRIELVSRVSQRLISRKMRSPDLPDESEIEVDHFEAVGQGAALLDLRQPTPIERKVTVKSMVAGSIAIGGQASTPIQVGMTVKSVLTHINPSDADDDDDVAGGIPGGAPGGAPGGIPGGVLGGVPVGASGAEVQYLPISSVMDNAIYTPAPDARKLNAAAPADKPEELVITVGFCVTIVGKTGDINTVDRAAMPRLKRVIDLVEGTVATWRFKPFMHRDEAVKTCTQRDFAVTFE